MLTKAKNSREKIIKITMLGLLTALIILFGLTPIGFIKIGILEITFLSVPVAIGAITMGPSAGAFLGLVFGLTSLYQAAFMNSFGQFLLNLNAFYAIIVFVVARVLMGLMVGLVSLAVRKFIKGTPSQLLGYGIVSAAASVLNSVFFLGFMALFFGGNSDVLAGFGQSTVWGLLALIVGTNAIAELVFAIAVGTALTKIVCHILPKLIRER